MTSKNIFKINEQLKNLQQKFFRSLPKQVQKITAAWNKSQQSGWNQQNIMELYRLCHNMSGSAQTFELPTLSDIAKQICLELKPYTSDAVAIADHTHQRISKLLERLVNEANSKDRDHSLRSNYSLDLNTDDSRQISNQIVVVEDDIDQAEIISQALTEAGYQVETYTDMAEFRNSYTSNKEPPGAVFMDMIFPEGDYAGAEAADEILKHYETKIPIIFASVRDDMEARLAALKAGATRFLVKPINTLQLINMLNGLTRQEATNPYRVLLVDDESHLLEFYSNILKQAGMTVESTSSPIAAWSIAKTFNPDIIVSDVYMPECSGPELAQVFRQDDHFAQIPILFLSVEQELDKQISILGLGGDDFIPKNIEPNRFIACVKARAQRSRHIKRINGELRAALQERDFQQFALNQHAIVSATNASGEIIYVNSKFCEISGYSRSELIGKNHRILKSGLHSPSFYQELWGNISNGLIWSGEICNRHKDGGLYWVEATIVPFLDDSGSPTQYVSVRTDITVLKENEDRLKRSQNFANIGTWDWNILSNELIWSERMAPLLGYSEPIVHASYNQFLDHVYPEDKTALENAINACITGTASLDIEHRVCLVDGSIRWVHQKGNVIRDNSGRPIHVLGVTLDIDERIEAQAYLNDARNEAETANQAKSDFLSNMSHELRTPMNAILGFSQLLLADANEPLSANQRESVDEIMHAGNHLLELINDILDLAKIESGKIALHIERIDLKDLLQECERLVEPLARKKDIQLAIHFEEFSDQLVLADRIRVKQVLLNYLSNAIKYNKPGGLIDIKGNNPAPGMLRISVVDTGIGISKDNQVKLFQSFNRLAVENSSVEGTGIGLVITKRLVEEMKGRVGVQSEINKGSVFWFELPLTNSLDTDHKIISSANKMESDKTKSFIVLYIEDNQANLRLVAQLLEQRGNIKFISAQTPSQGLDLANAHRPNLIFLDINLPEMDGYQVFDNLLNNPATRDIPVVAISANAMASDIEKGRNAGFDVYLTKPIDIEHFYQILDEKMN